MVFAGLDEGIAEEGASVTVLPVTSVDVDDVVAVC